MVDQLGPGPGDAVGGASSPAAYAHDGRASTTGTTRSEHEQRQPRAAGAHAGPAPGPVLVLRLSTRSRAAGCCGCSAGRSGAPGAAAATGGTRVGRARGPAHELLGGQGPPAAVEDAQLHPGVHVRATDLAVARQHGTDHHPARVRRPGWPAGPSAAAYCSSSPTGRGGEQRTRRRRRSRSWPGLVLLLAGRRTVAVAPLARAGSAARTKTLRIGGIGRVQHGRQDQRVEPALPHHDAAWAVPSQGRVEASTSGRQAPPR